MTKVVLLSLLLLGCEECTSSSDCPLDQICVAGECQGGSVDEATSDEVACADAVLLEPAVVIIASDLGGGSGAVRLVGPSVGAVEVFEAMLEQADTGCGEFAVDGDLSDVRLGADERFDFEVEFLAPDGVTKGCSLGCAATLRVMLASPMGCLSNAVQLLASGDCAWPLRCDKTHIDFGASWVDESYDQQLVCRNYSDIAHTVRGVGLEDGSAAAFGASLVGGEMPLVLEPGAAATVSVTYDPTQEAQDKGAVLLLVDDASEISVPLSGGATRKRPLCSDGIPEAPTPELEGPDYTIVLESEVPSLYPGTVRAQWFYDEPPLMSDITVTTGSFSDPECKVTQSGHMALAQGSACDPETGTLHNIHAVPHSQTIEDWVRGLEVWDEVSVQGWEVERIDYDNGSWWTDAGCNTLVITWICDGV